MSEKMRGALFNVLGDITGFTVFDAYGGSGALAFEAISRGAKNALIIEIDKYAWAIIKQNIENLGLEGIAKAVRANVTGWSDNNYDTKFDLALCDPPYENIKLEQLGKLTTNVKKGGIYVLSLPSLYLPPKIESLKLIKNSDYGDGSLAFYRKI